jgi:hypothetical protein
VTSSPEGGSSSDRPYETAEAAVGHGADGGPELTEDVAQQAATGISSPDADDQAGKQAPASEGALPN